MSGILMASVGNSYGSAPVNTVAPAVTGTAQSGQTLSCSTGTWLGAPAPTFTYQWQHGTTNIGGANSSTYLLDRSYIGETIRCVVTATNSVAPSGVSANSNSTSAVVAVPLNTVAPVVSGTAQVRQTLSCTTGTWTGTATISFSYQWKRAGTNVGTNSSSYTLVSADSGSTMSCVVTGTNTQGSANGTSNSTSAVAANVPLAPTIGTATATGSSTASVSFTAPSDNGGATITGYTTSGGGSGSGGGSPISVTGLSASTSYSFTVTATNSAGTSAASGSSNTITTSVTPPGAIGSAYQGGFYAGQISTSANGVATHYLVVSDVTVGQTTAFWGPTTSNTGVTSTINGPANTAALAALGSGYAAATFCENLNTGGYTDWYLGAFSEMGVVYYFLKPETGSNNTSYGSNPYAVSPQPLNTNYTSGSPAQTSATNFRGPNFQQAFQGNYYWVSTDGTNNYGSYITNFIDGEQILRYKAGNQKLRAIRRVPV